MATCTSITKINSLADGTDVLDVVIDNDVHAYWFYEYAKALEFVNQEVIVEYRKDVYNGQLCTFIATFTIPTKVNTLTKKDNIRLYCDQIDNNSNLVFDEVQIGETKMGCIVYCISQEYKSSPNAVWMELLIRDKKMKVAKLRLFDYADKSVVLAGQYVMTSLARNKYGFQSDLIKPVTGEVAPNPEIDIAIQFIKNYFADDPVSMDYLSKTNVIGYLKEHTDYEKGYGLMRLAMELSMVDNLNNISKDLDHVAIGRALLAARGYMTKESALSDSFVNISIAMHFNWDDRTTVLQLLDVESDKSPREYEVMKSIVSTVNTIIEVRKGVKPI